MNSNYVMSIAFFLLINFCLVIASQNNNDKFQKKSLLHANDLSSKEITLKSIIEKKRKEERQLSQDGVVESKKHQHDD